MVVGFLAACIKTKRVVAVQYLGRLGMNLFAGFQQIDTANAMGRDDCSVDDLYQVVTVVNNVFYLDTEVDIKCRG